MIFEGSVGAQVIKAMLAAALLGGFIYFMKFHKKKKE